MHDKMLKAGQTWRIESNIYFIIRFSRYENAWMGLVVCGDGADWRSIPGTELMFALDEYVPVTSLASYCELLGEMESFSYESETAD